MLCLCLSQYISMFSQVIRSLSPAVLSPISLDIIMTILGHHQGPLQVIVPHHAAQTVSVVLHSLVVGLGQELVVEDPVGEHEPVPLLLPQLDLVRDGGRDASSHAAAAQHVHLQELNDLVGCDATSETQAAMMARLH